MLTCDDVHQCLVSCWLENVSALKFHLTNDLDSVVYICVCVWGVVYIIVKMDVIWPVKRNFPINLLSRPNDIIDQ